MSNVPPSTPATPAAPSGLSSAAEIEALADQLTEIADEIHKRVVKSVNAYKGKPVPEIEQSAARALIDAEYELRQRANGLHADAATLVVQSLGKPQQHLLALTAAAAEKIRRIAYLGQVTGLVGSVLSLAAAAATGQPIAILGAVDKLRTSIKGVQTYSPPAAS